MTTLASSDIGRILENSQLSETVLARMQATLLQAEEAANFERALLAERVLGVALMRNVIGGDMPWPDAERPMPVPAGNPQSTGWWSRPMMRTMVVNYLRDMGQQLDAARDPWPQVLDRFTVGSASQKSSVLAPAMVTTVTTIGKALAHLRACRVAVMIERYRRAHGRVPDQLAELVPTYAAALPTDPFTGKELIYHHDADTYTVYSVGKDRHDDGGTEAKLDAFNDVGVRIRLARP